MARKICILVDAPDGVQLRMTEPEGRVMSMLRITNDAAIARLPESLHPLFRKARDEGIDVQLVTSWAGYNGNQPPERHYLVPEGFSVPLW